MLQYTLVCGKFILVMKNENRGRPPANEQDQKKQVTAQVRIATVDKLEALALAEGRSLSNTVAFLLESHPKIAEVSTNV